MIRLAFLGAGRMASAMVGGILQKGLFKPEEIGCTSAADGTGEALAAKTGIQLVRETAELLATAEIVVLAFKPQQLKDIGPEFAPLTAGKLVLSILAGSTLARLGARFPQARNLVRSMPNTPGMVGAGVTAYASREALSDADRSLTEGILGALGVVLALPEDKLNAVTGLSGSGPAYVFEFVAALRDGGIAAGLDPETSYRLALHTVLGAAQLLVAVPETPETHRDWVTSPKGTTLAGLTLMQERDFRSLMKDTVLAAARRSEELAAGT